MSKPTQERMLIKAREIASSYPDYATALSAMVDLIDWITENE